MSTNIPQQSGPQSGSPRRRASEDRIIGDFIEIGDPTQVSPEELSRAESLLLTIPDDDDESDAADCR